MTVAHVVHELGGRIRLRIPERRNDAAFFEMLAEYIGQTEAVDSVAVDALTASVLIHHQLPPNALKSRLTKEFGLQLEPAPSPSKRHGLAPLGQGVHALDEGLRKTSDGAADLRTLLFILLVMLAIRQALRGQIMIPAAALLWNAMELVLRSPSAPEQDTTT